MEILFGIAAFVLLVLSFIGIVKVLARILAIICVIVAVWFWMNGGKEKVDSVIADGKNTLEEGAGKLIDAGSNKVNVALSTGFDLFLKGVSDLTADEKKLLEQAMVDPASVSAASRSSLRETIAKVRQQSGVVMDKETSAALQKLERVLGQ